MKAKEAAGLHITLPYPDKRLSPNARVHWAVKSKLNKKHKIMATVETLRILKGRTFKADSYRIIGLVSDHRRRDLDNLVSICKGILDGLAAALGQDDSEWKFKGAEFIYIGNSIGSHNYVKVELKGEFK